ncbi:MAG: hypothetical protein EZS28_022762 [Streblomastix strix]|uniref:Calponin-homology (CH) domain-containing protein n=1 Tax=Streblomastix strix TaxID=222440 RepID=A0A5J4VGR4_9EUKA|nr:MAG: hypothetical protein EZS28_022762 [Streblomastix strix]
MTMEEQPVQPQEENNQIIEQANIFFEIESKVGALYESRFRKQLKESLSDAARNGTLVEIMNALCPGKHVEYMKNPNARFTKIDNISALNEVASKKFNIPFEDLLEPLCHVDALLQVQIAQLMWHLMVIMDKRGYLLIDIHSDTIFPNPTDEDIIRAIRTINTAQNARQLQKKEPIILVLDGIH